MRASPWAQLRLSATASIEALAAASVHVVESYARSRIELARAEFRQGRVNEGLNTLESLMRSLRSEFDTGEPNQGIDLVLAIAYSVLAQGVEQAGDNETAGGYYRESASRFHQLDEDLLSPRDQSDYGMALAAADEEEAGYARLLGSRQTGGATPEASRRMATILLKGGDAGAAEELLRETSRGSGDGVRGGGGHHRRHGRHGDRRGGRLGLGPGGAHGERGRGRDREERGEAHTRADP